MKYRVLIIDDEAIITEGLNYLIRKYLPECEVVGIAYSGTEGLEKTVHMRPDIILTDIRMPDMDGIEMTSQLREKGYTGEIIILSGYADFEYARRALRIGIQEYITKPVEEEELFSALKRACAFVKVKREKIQKTQMMEETIEHYALKDILDGRMDASQIGAFIHREDENLWKQKFCCVLLEDEQGRFEKLAEKVNLQIDTIIKGYWKNLSLYYMIPYSKKWFVLLLPTDRIRNEEDVKTLLQRIQRVFGEKDIRLNIGASRFCHQINQWKDAFEEATCALNYKVLQGSGCIVFYEGIKRLPGQYGLLQQEEVERLEACLNRMDNVGCQQIVEQVFRRVEKENISLEDIQQLSLNLILSGIRTMPFMQFQLNEYLGKNILSLESIAKFQTIEQLKNWIVNTLRSIHELASKDQFPEKHDIIEEAKAFMEKNFSKGISLNDISEQFYINPIYFSQLFKKKTGQTYQNYLTNLRVERAEILLKETDLKIYEISALVGYSDSTYFNKVFEKRIGLRPSVYRKKINEG